MSSTSPRVLKERREGTFCRILSGVDFDSLDAKRPVENRRIYSSAGYKWAKPLWQETNEAIWAEIQS
ncbi:hypothetical protein [Corynebacterium sp.]|uniref:hypothetical protein n=1 Tax=Corynebacterium sp. TaxID=1720 RepID=UPI00258025D6|nr:hypothetical protein [Corynebacterium sp.]